MLYLLALHENNAIVLYSPTLSRQILTSRAANAFNVFQQGLHRIEIVRLCALWDTPDLAKENISTIIELVDHPEVIEALAEEASSHWRGTGGRVYPTTDDPDLQARAEEALQRSNEEFGEQQAQKARDELRKANRRQPRDPHLAQARFHHEPPRQAPCSFFVGNTPRKEGRPLATHEIRR